MAEAGSGIPKGYIAVSSRLKFMTPSQIKSKDNKKTTQKLSSFLYCK